MDVIPSDDDEVASSGGETLTSRIGDQDVVDQANAEPVIEAKYGRLDGNHHACLQRVVATGIDD